MIKILNKSACSGCTACASICAHNAISMKADVLGFLYPIVDTGKCVDCKMCEKVCSFKESYDLQSNYSFPHVYAARHNDLNEILRSRSGAIFVALSDYFIERGGVVYGAGFDEHFRVVHKRALTKHERNDFRGSKYVQSDMGEIFKCVHEDLNNGLLVLFSGTPCQTAGLRSYIPRKLHKKLLIVDIICDGTPAPNIWRDYLIYLEKENNSFIKTVCFRDKSSNGWHDHIESFVFNNGKRIECTDYTTKFFYSHIALRPSCSICPFTNIHRPSDITLGDFWGYEDFDYNLNSDDKGVNIVLINTEQGNRIFGCIQSNISSTNITTNVYMQPRLQYPVPKHRKRDQFENDYLHNGFNYVFKYDYNKLSLIEKILRRVNRLLKYEK